MAFIIILFVLLSISLMSLFIKGSSKTNVIKLLIGSCISVTIVSTIGIHYKEIYLYDNYKTMCDKFYVLDESQMSAAQKSTLIDECREINERLNESKKQNSIWSFYPKRSKELIPLDYSKLL